MYYTRLRAACPQEFSEILIAETAEAGFDTFMETPEGFEAFAEEDRYDAAMLEDIRRQYAEVCNPVFALDRVEKENWNEQWEKSFEPVIVGDQCIVRAEFHRTERAYPYEIIITPKMSFGTGHHATTWLMLNAQLGIDHSGKNVMDAGCGTAILAIMACKRGAKMVDAFDIDEWSAVNGKENLDNNGCGNVLLRQGTIRTLSFDEPFDLILANINRNVLLSDMDAFATNLRTGGQLLLSGFYPSDAVDLVAAAAAQGFELQRQEEREGWCSLLLRRVG
ncbi:MAG: 50S ribosomal protein L11 methyltransferase [Bacteroidota bacterium]